jgi:hypothetical protein
MLDKYLFFALIYILTAQDEDLCTQADLLKAFKPKTNRLLDDREYSTKAGNFQ